MSRPLGLPIRLALSSSQRARVWIVATWFSFWIVTTGCQLHPCREPSSQVSGPGDLMESLDPAIKPTRPGTRAAEKKTSSGPTSLVFKYNGERQCGEGTIRTLDEMQKELSGIHVVSRSLRNDGLLRVAMCGTTTGVANVYEIPASDSKKAQALGFRIWTYDR